MQRRCAGGMRAWGRCAGFRELPAGCLRKLKVNVSFVKPEKTVPLFVVMRIVSAFFLN